MCNIQVQFHHRDPGIVGLLTSLKVPEVYYGLISDGYHTHNTVQRIAYHANKNGAQCILYNRKYWWKENFTDFENLLVILILFCVLIKLLLIELIHAYRKKLNIFCQFLKTAKSTNISCYLV